nr:MAG TPA: hypothetical protein [Caudoviricetes sp.]
MFKNLGYKYGCLLVLILYLIIRLLINGTYLYCTDTDSTKQSNYRKDRQMIIVIIIQIPDTNHLHAVYHRKGNKYVVILSKLVNRSFEAVARPDFSTLLGFFDTTP